MSMKTSIAGRVRGIFAGQSYGENREDELLHINPRGDLIVTQGLPELAEICRLGNSWQASYGTGVTALAALPTTTAHLSLYNGEPANGNCYVIDTIGCWSAVQDVTQGQNTALFAMNNRITSAYSRPTASAMNIASLLGKGAYGGNAVFANSLGVVNDGWFPHQGPGVGSVTAVGGAIWKVTEANVRGLYLVRPGGLFNIAAVQGGAGGGVSGMFYYMRWHEVSIAYKA